MPTILNPYLSFRDTAKQVMEFYQSVFGGELASDTFDSGGMGEAYPGEGDKIMHAQLTTPDGLTLMASDTPNSMEVPPSSSISISISGEDDAALTTYFDKLADGGTVNQPLVEAPWGGKFGMVTDRFGTDWMVAVNPS